ncbi:histidine kinase [Christensenellaceae bacterium OttesenSCG-928-K19]|nr:histidine kinase [Christensenellaceae bacterium OttesenSCG-928-K19]
MRWLDRLLLYALGMILLSGQAVDTVFVVAFVAAFTAACLAGYVANKAMIVAICGIWVVVSFMSPAFVFFWPLFVYEVFLHRLYPLMVLPVVCILWNAGGYAALEVMMLVFACALGVFLAVRGTKAERLAREVLDVRDAAREASLELGQRNKELVEAQDYEVRIATLTERGRIAREIHDNVGHMLTRAMLQTGAAIATAKDENARAGLEEVNETLALAMNSVRQSVHGLRDESFDLYGMVQACVRDFPGYECNLNYDMGKKAPRDVQYCFAAVIREAYSNVQRHSNATRVTIDLQEHPAFYRLLFQDNGTQKKKMDKTGMGLENMKERTRTLSGQFHAQWQKGFSIHIMIPKEKQEGEA